VIAQKESIYVFSKEFKSQPDKKMTSEITEVLSLLDQVCDKSIKF